MDKLLTDEQKSVIKKPSAKPPTKTIKKSINYGGRIIDNRIILG